jgi:hypothetical protein
VHDQGGERRHEERRAHEQATGEWASHEARLPLPAGCVKSATVG